MPALARMAWLGPGNRNSFREGPLLRGDCGISATTKEERDALETAGEDAGATMLRSRYFPVRFVDLPTPAT
jgi:hypothetical protein